MKISKFLKILFAAILILPLLSLLALAQDDFDEDEIEPFNDGQIMYEDRNTYVYEDKIGGPVALIKNTPKVASTYKAIRENRDWKTIVISKQTAIEKMGMSKKSLEQSAGKTIPVFRNGIGCVVVINMEYVKNKLGALAYKYKGDIRDKIKAELKEEQAKPAGKQDLGVITTLYTKLKERIKGDRLVEVLAAIVGGILTHELGHVQQLFDGKILGYMSMEKGGKSITNYYDQVDELNVRKMEKIIYDKVGITSSFPSHKNENTIKQCVKLDKYYKKLSETEISATTDEMKILEKRKKADQNNKQITSIEDFCRWYKKQRTVVIKTEGVPQNSINFGVRE